MDIEIATEGTRTSTANHCAKRPKRAASKFYASDYFKFNLSEKKIWLLNAKQVTWYEIAPGEDCSPASKLPRPHIKEQMVMGVDCSE